MGGGGRRLLHGGGSWKLRPTPECWTSVLLCVVQSQVTRGHRGRSSNQQSKVPGKILEEGVGLDSDKLCRWAQLSFSTLNRTTFLSGSAESNIKPAFRDPVLNTLSWFIIAMWSRCGSGQREISFTSSNLFQSRPGWGASPPLFPPLAFLALAQLVLHI